MRFFPTAAAAQRAGFRACKRCVPDASPGSPEWDRRADVVGRAMRLITEGVIDREGVRGLAARLGYSVRQLERHLVAEVGAGPLALARAQRARTARILIDRTDLPFSEVAFASGFASVRQFNDTVRAVFAAAPRDLRQRGRSSTPPVEPGSLVVRLPFRQPMAVDPALAALSHEALPGVEQVGDGTYCRSLRLPSGFGIVALTLGAEWVECQLRLDDLRDLPAATARCRRLLDLDADPAVTDGALLGDRQLGPLVRSTPGLRVVRSVDGAELALRTVLAQGVSGPSARRRAERLCALVGTSLSVVSGEIRRVFPRAEDVADADLAPLGLPPRSEALLRSVAESIARGQLCLDAGADRSQARRMLGDLPGLTGWAAEVIAVRALGDPDGFPAADPPARRAAGRLSLPQQSAALAVASRQWSPWRASAWQHLRAEGLRRGETD